VDDAEQAEVVNQPDREPENDKQNNEEMDDKNKFDHRIKTRYR
jgi:hypothetical protein